MLHLMRVSQTNITVFNNRLFDSSILWKRDPKLFISSDHKCVPYSCCKCLTANILNVNDFNRSRMFFATDNSTDTTSVMTSSNYNLLPNFELDEI